ncbi:MAG TPA: calcium-binding protein [Solirubrobacteraceae bacterium]|nr:calcium-binding protein [Solirubrobacteraceae bacterium]
MRAPLLGAATGLALIAPAAPASAETTASVSNGTLDIVGDNASDNIVVGPVGGSNLFLDFDADGVVDQIVPLPMFDNIAVATGGGDDQVTFSQAGGPFTTTHPATVDGGEGNDALIGSDGNETFSGGAGDDFIDANRGNDVVSGGPGDDGFQWDPGDGSDTIDGDDGNDTLQFNASNAAENITVTPNGSRATLHRDVAAITMDLGTLERLNVPLLGGNDVFTASEGLGSLVLGIDGGAGNDTLTGAGEPDVFSGGTEDDLLSGGGGDDQLFDDAGTDDLDGGDGADTFHCGGAGDTVAFDAMDQIGADCLPLPTPTPPGPNPAPTPAPTQTEPVTSTPSVGGSGSDSAPTPQAPTAPRAPVLPTANGLAAGERGFATPKGELAGAGLKVTVANTADQPIRISVTASARAGHRRVRFGRASATLAAGQSRTVTLHASRRALRGHRLTHPVVTVRNVDTGGTLTLRPRR